MQLSPMGSCGGQTKYVQVRDMFDIKHGLEVMKRFGNASYMKKCICYYMLHVRRDQALSV